MSEPLFHIVKGNEFGLSGIADPTGGEWGSMHMPTLSMRTDDCSIVNGEVMLPEGYAEPVYNAKFLQFSLSIVNVGGDWPIPSPEDNPDLFITWPCNNPSKRKQLKDFVIITFTNEVGEIVKEAKYPGLFFEDTFKNQSIYSVSNRYPFAGQRIQMDFIPDGTYQVEIKVNPIYGQSEPAVVLLKITGHDLALVEQPSTTFPEGLVWKAFKPEELDK